MGEAMCQLCGVFADLERSIIHERVKAGLERAKAKGVTLGRPVGDRISRSTGGAPRRRSPSNSHESARPVERAVSRRLFALIVQQEAPAEFSACTC